MAAVTPNDIAVIRGSVRPGSASRRVSGAIASHPTNDIISTDAADPVAPQPCGAKGVQCVARAACSDPTTAAAITASSNAIMPICTLVPMRAPASVSVVTSANNPAATTAVLIRPPPVSAVMYPAPIRHTTGAPSTTAVTKHQPTARPARRPSPAVVYAMTPPPPGSAIPSAVNTSANRPDTDNSPPHATIDAGPASP